MNLYFLNTDNLTDADRARVARKLPKRYEAALRIQKENARESSIGAGLLFLKCLGVAEECDLLEGPHGKPYRKSGPAFNLSHSGNKVVLAVSDSTDPFDPVGVDIETIRTGWERAVDRVFTAEEIDWANDDPERFAMLWTAKEAAVKAIGTGFSISPLSFSVLPLFSGGPVLIQKSCLFGHVFVYEGAAVTVLSG